MYFYLFDELWSKFSAAVDEWLSENTLNSFSTEYDFKEANVIVQKMASSVDTEPEHGQFSSHFFRVFMNHLRLQQLIEGKDVYLALNAVGKLWNSIGNRYNFELSSNLIKELLNIGIRIESTSSLLEDEHLKRMAASVERLSKIASGIHVTKGRLSLDNGFSDKVFMYLDKKMAQLGGREFLAHYVGHTRMPQLYDSKFDRYLICRQDYLGEQQEPVHFLLHIAAKHFSVHPARRWEYQTDLHDEIINVAIDFLEVCDLQGNTGISYSMMDPREVTYHINNELFFYKMCIPFQYSSRFILSSLKYLIKDCFSEAGLRYTYRDYYAITEYFMGHNWWEKKRFQSIDEIHLATNVAKYKLKIILSDISIHIKEINKDFNAFDAYTNFFDYPLIYDPNLGYCCFDRILCGRGFLIRINQLIKNKKKDLDKFQGQALERWLREEMTKKGYEVKYGKYPSLGGLKEGECDFVLEDNRIHFLELKKQEVMKDFNEVDDVSLWGSIGKGMIRAQKQCFAHELYLRKNRTINLSTGMKIILTSNNLPASKISICFGEYFYIASKAYVILLLKTILKNGEVMAKNTERQKELMVFNKYRREILDIIRDQNILMGRKITIEELQPYSLFCSLQQILMVVWNTSNEKEFLEVIKEWELRIDGAADLYISLFEKLNRKPGSVSQAMFDFAKSRDIPPLLIS